MGRVPVSPCAAPESYGGDKLLHASPSHLADPTCPLATRDPPPTVHPPRACGLLARIRQSFYEQGYAGTQFFERCGNIIDDKYHDVGDVVDRQGFDLAGELVSLSRGVAATAFTLLEPIG